MIISAKALSILVAVYVLSNPAIDAQPSNPQAVRQAFLSSLLNVDPIPPRENIKRTAILNTLIEKFHYQSYLEIGQGRKQDNFDWIQCKTKIGVDPDKTLGAAYPLTSDEFFALNKNSFDLIFIDGLHHADQVEKDILNALKVLNNKGTIVVHDCNPKTEEMQIVPQQQATWTGDGWKTWAKLRATRPDLKMYVIDVDFGCGIIQKQDRTLEAVRANRQMSYSVFAKNRKKLLNLIDVADFLRSLKNSSSKSST
jgi:hypothetical protein